MTKSDNVLKLRGGPNWEMRANGIEVEEYNELDFEHVVLETESNDGIPSPRLAWPHDQAHFWNWIEEQD